MKYYIFYLSVGFLLYACGGGTKTDTAAETTPGEATAAEDSIVKGTVGHVELSDPPDTDLIAEGQSIYDSKCSKCHTLNSEKSKGPGWAGITNRRAPEWIMNMILNVNVMLDVDSLAHSLLEDADMEMPDQRIPVNQARSVLEFMRQNDLNQLGNKDQGVGTSEE